MGQEENTELREKLEVLEEDITDQQVTKISTKFAVLLFLAFIDPKEKCG